MLTAFVLAMSLVLPSSAAATPESPSTDSAIQLLVLLDPEQGDLPRGRQLKALRAAADAGDHGAQCLLGRMGVQKALFADDLPMGGYGVAADYLNACVLGGDIEAMLVLAEVELHARRPLEAMIWAQAYLKLAQVFGSEYVNSAGAYKAGLIARIERAYHGKRPDNEEILEYTAGLLAQHGERILHACEAGGCAWAASMMPKFDGERPDVVGRRNSTAGKFTRDYTDAEDELVFASFLVEVDESGRAARVLTLESYPDATAAKQLVSHPRTRRFNEVEAGSGMRYLVMPVFMDNKAFKLIPDAPPRRRPPRS